jgi:glycosyltransferase involved in cell wall biosynthesis
MQIVMVADIDVSSPFGDTGRVITFATGLQERGYRVILVVPSPKEPEMMVNANGLNLEFISIKQIKGSMFNMIHRMWSLIHHAKKLCRQNDSRLLVETSPLGGYFALTGASGYVLDVHGISFEEIIYAYLPWYIPRKAYAKFTKYLEYKGTKSASRVIVVSASMANLLTHHLNVNPDKISIIPNGYFVSIFKKVMRTGYQEEKGAVTFVGLIEKWAAVDKILRAANALRKEKAKFYIVGDGPHRAELEKMKEKLALGNVIFTGKLSLNEAYTMIAKSEIALLPFPKTIATEVACPIKVIEYMALGKAMVVDDVSDLSHFLKDHDAALVCDPNDEQEFFDNIKLLLHDPEMRKKIGDQARALAGSYSWDIQVAKLHEVLAANWGR